MSGATPLDDGARFGLKAAVWNRYDQARRLPGNFLVIGDAVCSFNPIYGQGISVAVSEALVLRDSLAGRSPGPRSEVPPGVPAGDRHRAGS